jgi:hypothetical protein
LEEVEEEAMEMEEVVLGVLEVAPKEMLNQKKGCHLKEGELDRNGNGII